VDDIDGLFTVTTLPSLNLPLYSSPWQLDVPIRFASAKPPVAASRSLYLNNSSFFFTLDFFFEAGHCCSAAQEEVELFMKSLAVTNWPEEFALHEIPMYPNFTDHCSNSMSHRCNSILELDLLSFTSDHSNALATTASELHKAASYPSS
jgi:hypothetical protein